MARYGIYDGSAVIAQFVAPMTVRSNVPVYTSDTLSLKRFSYKRPAQRWELETGLEPLNAGGQELFVHLVTKGITDTFQIITPQNYGVILRRTSTASITASGTAGNSSATVGGNSGLISKGTFVKFAGHSKVYMTTADLTGNGSLHVFPNLRATFSNAAVSHLDDVQMTVSYDIDTSSGMSYKDGILMDVGTIKLVERL